MLFRFPGLFASPLCWCECERRGSALFSRLREALGETKGFRFLFAARGPGGKPRTSISQYTIERVHYHPFPGFLYSHIFETGSGAPRLAPKAGDAQARVPSVFFPRLPAAFFR